MVLRAWLPSPAPTYLHIPTRVITKRTAQLVQGPLGGTIGHKGWRVESRCLDQAEGCLWPSQEQSPCGGSRARGSPATQSSAMFPQWEGKDPAWDGFQG